MSNYDFFINYFFLYGARYFIALTICIFIYVPIIRKTVKSILDPMFYALVMAIFANAIPIFLYMVDLIALEKLIYVILCEGIFWITFFLFAKKEIKFSSYEMKESNIGDYCFFFFYILLLTSSLITYVKFGIPIFNEHRLETYSSGGGWGILLYIINFTTFFCSSYSFFCIYKKKYILLSYIVLGSIAVFSFLSGAKSSILVVVYSFFFFRYFYLRKAISIRKYLPFLFVLFIFPVVILSIQNESTIELSLVSLLQRFVANGDIYWMAFPNDVVDDVVINNEITYLFSRILTQFHIIDRSTMDLPIGVQIDWIVVPSHEGNILGPNTRLPVLCWILFRWSGLLLAAVFGLICAIWRSWLPKLLPRGILPVIIYGYIYNSLCSMFTDPLFGTSYLFFITVFLVILFFSYLFFGGRYIVLRRVYE